MRAIVISCLASGVIICATPSMADHFQADHFQAGHPAMARQGRWDGDGFWRGAGSDIAGRIGFMQGRIDTALAEGRLSGYEGHRLSHALALIRRDVWQYHGPMTQDWRNNIQWRLDNLGAQIRWEPEADESKAPRFATAYDAARDYRDEPGHHERPLAADDEVYRGSDGRVYCQRGDGTTGLVVGAVGGAAIASVIGSVIGSEMASEMASRHDRGAGMLIGGTLGAMAGQQLNANSSVRCR